MPRAVGALSEDIAGVAHRDIATAVADAAVAAQGQGDVGAGRAFLIARGSATAGWPRSRHTPPAAADAVRENGVGTIAGRLDAAAVRDLHRAADIAIAARAADGEREALAAGCAAGGGIGFEIEPATLKPPLPPPPPMLCA